MPFTIEERIDRPVAEVFAFVADGTNMPRWYEAVREVQRLDEGPIAVGSRYRMVRRLPGGPAVNVVEIAEYQPDAVVTLVSVEGPTPFRYRYIVHPTDEQATEVRLEGEIRGDGLQGPAALLAPLASRFFARGMAANLAELKRTLEGA